MKNPLRLPLCVVAALALFASGCIEFEQQTATFQHDPKADTLKLFQIFHGIYSSDVADGPSDDEKRQWDSLFSGQRTFFFANWILELNRAQLEEALADTRNSSPGDDAGIRRKKQTEEFLTFLLANLRVENGSLYLDSKQRLCGVQRVTFSSISKILTLSTPVLRAVMADEANKSDKPADEREAITKWLARNESPITLADQALVLRLPMPRDNFERDLTGSERARKSIAALKAAGGSVTYTNDAAHIRLPAAPMKPTSITLPVAEKETYNPAFLKYVRGKQTVAEKFSPDAAAAEFLGSAKAKP